MATGDEGSEEYDRQLQQLMLDSLPNILVEVVERRPTDPIEFMAHELYRYRGREPPAVTVSSNTQRNAQAHNIPLLNTGTQISRNKTAVEKMNQEYSIVQANEDFDDAVHDLECDVSEVTGRLLHVDILEIFNCIGDLYDDDDAIS